MDPAHRPLLSCANSAYPCKRSAQLEKNIIIQVGHLLTRTHQVLEQRLSSSKRPTLSPTAATTPTSLRSSWVRFADRNVNILRK